jgi:hypothetical protein
MAELGQTLPTYPAFKTARCLLLLQERPLHDIAAKCSDVP